MGGLLVSQTAGRGADCISAMLWALTAIECHAGPLLWLPSAVTHRQNIDYHQFQPPETLLLTCVGSNCNITN